MPLTRQHKKDHNISDLETYAMASEDVIDAKLEAFETCMENKLSALFAEFRLGLSLSLTRSQQGESSVHKENPPEKEEQATDSASARGLCRRYGKPWSRDHCCKKRRLLMIEPIEKSKEEDPKPKEEDTKDPQPVVSMVHAFAGYINPQTMKIEGFLEQQLVIILIDTGSTKNSMNSKVAARLMLQKEDCNGFDVKVADDRILKYN
ncbi:hypothetical protein BHE74_00035097 [Ensete ventricosum]|nr:hypothetical protein GW17_00041081 [Ensete ventricosum]RWW58071.1 hypothetical protein BHE74_00035097 [Ensete ventricosum]RZS03730.1 hypothetical protein BHM03_00033942 [Ensete ventricosum]